MNRIAQRSIFSFSLHFTSLQFNSSSLDHISDSHISFFFALMESHRPPRSSICRPIERIYFRNCLDPSYMLRGACWPRPIVRRNAEKNCIKPE
jgi:hypothetical protein